MVKKSKRHANKKKHSTKNNNQIKHILTIVIFIIFGFSAIGFAAWFTLANKPETTYSPANDKPYNQTQESQTSSQSPGIQQNEQSSDQIQNKEHVNENSNSSESNSSVAPTEPANSDGSTDYLNYCARCHGEKGEGISAPKLTGIKENANEIAGISERGTEKMPSFSNQLNEEQLLAVAEYIKSL
jgi:cytochrome c553